MSTYEKLAAAVLGFLFGWFVMGVFQSKRKPDATVLHATNVVTAASSTQQALYGAFQAGYIVGANGGTEIDGRIVFLEIVTGNTNALKEFTFGK